MVSNICYFHPKLWGRFPFWLIFFSNGWFNHQLVNVFFGHMFWVSSSMYRKICSLDLWCFKDFRSRAHLAQICNNFKAGGFLVASRIISSTYRNDGFFEVEPPKIAWRNDFWNLKPAFLRFSLRDSQLVPGDDYRVLCPRGMFIVVIPAKFGIAYRRTVLLRKWRY